MGRSDETFLESFIEHLSSLPAEVHRNLDLMKDLENTTGILFDQMATMQHEYVGRVEDKILSLEMVNNGTKVKVLGSGPNRPSVIPTTEELRAYVEEPETLKRIATLEEDVQQRAEEKVAIAEQTYRLVDNICKRLDSDLADMKGLLQRVGEFQTPGMAKPNDLAAIQVIPGSPDWILAKVISHNVQTGMYRLSDEDTESSKIFDLPENQVVILGTLKSLARGDIVYAVYPDTTAFYQATIVQGSRKVGGGGSFVMVHFVDDSDEHGVTHDKAVLLQHIMRPPYGVTLQ